MPIPRRDFLRTTAAGLALLGTGTVPRLGGGIDRPRPSRAQLAWQRDELAMFVHFGVNTFTDREWGDGSEHPSIFQPTALDARQWARTAKMAGFKAMILTAKHHDGFCLWPTKTTTHSVASSPWRGGRGDVVREFVDACRAEGLRPGLYLSPWDRHEPRYGDSPAYNDVYVAQLTELLTQYGRIHEVWFDGANAEGPNGRRQVYDWPRTWATVRTLQPDAVMFSDAGPDVRWIGNERGAAGTTNWSTVDPRIVTVPGMSGDEVMRSLQDGDRDGTVWRPGETDVSIRPGWFHHPAEDAKVRTADDLVQLYFTSVGRNSKLLLNVPPGRDGRFHATDVANLLAMRAQLDAMFARDLTRGGLRRWRSDIAGRGTAEVTLPVPARVGIIDLREDIAQGQRVAQYTLDVHDGSAWRELQRGTTIGYRRLARVEAGVVHRVRVRVDDALEPPLPVTIGCYAG
ncbi:MAG: alpha-L-fucosidase [Gemmatimonadaceae bacterium]|nr:alpha-L-fucosidase [Gemmatimonadaceae bacterium]